uniref:Uncharacterized protein n=1 Tax=Globodera rostochiensis TaxID=31243 RepID=A0A914HNR5_GLORO
MALRFNCLRRFQHRLRYFECRGGTAGLRRTLATAQFSRAATPALPNVCSARRTCARLPVRAHAAPALCTLLQNFGRPGGHQPTRSIKNGFLLSVKMAVRRYCAVTARGVSMTVASVGQMPLFSVPKKDACDEHYLRAKELRQEQELFPMAGTLPQFGANGGAGGGGMAFLSSSGSSKVQLMFRKRFKEMEKRRKAEEEALHRKSYAETDVKRLERELEERMIRIHSLWVLSHGRYDEWASMGNRLMSNDFVGQLNADNCQFLIVKALFSQLLKRGLAPNIGNVRRTMTINGINNLCSFSIGCKSHLAAKIANFETGTCGNWKSPFEKVPNASECTGGYLGWHWRTETRILINVVRSRLVKMKKAAKFPQKARIHAHLTEPECDKWLESGGVFCPKPNLQTFFPANRHISIVLGHPKIVFFNCAYHQTTDKWPN